MCVTDLCLCMRRTLSGLMWLWEDRMPLGELTPWQPAGPNRSTPGRPCWDPTIYYSEYLHYSHKLHFIVSKNNAQYIKMDVVPEKCEALIANYKSYHFPTWTWSYSHDVNLSSSCGTGPQAFCAEDASLGAPASRERPAPLPECAPVDEIRRTISEQDVYSVIVCVCCTFPDLFLHQILQVRDPLRILWVTVDVVLIKEGLL